MNYFSEINKNYNVGIYIRLSREDEDKIYESESITNQRDLLLQYAKENNLRVYDIYIDDGYSGTNFDRPAFKRLINDIELKKVNMVITKDMSRLGRDYIETGNLIERYFPQKGIRYIAVTDNIDTFLDNSNNDIAPFKAIMNDMYAKDISKKIRTSLRAKQKEGKFVGGRAPFGYMKDPNNKNHLIINKEQAQIVKRIFEMALLGKTYFCIAKELTNEGIKTPAQYYDFKWKNNYNFNYGMWHSKSIDDILKNRIYTGDLVQNKRTKVNYKVKKIVRNKPEDYVVVPNTHEAIISKEIFEKVQKILPKNVGRKEKLENHLFDGLLYCGDCNHRISIKARRKKDNKCYTICNYYRTYMKKRLCTIHSNNYDKLEQVLLENIKKTCKKYIDKDKIKLETLSKIKVDGKSSYVQIINNLKNEIKRINDNLDNIYIDKLNKIVTDEQFSRVKTKLENELNIKKQKLIDYENELNDNINLETKNKTIVKYIEEFLIMKNPTRELILCLVDKIEIFEDKRINIYFTFKVE